MVIAQLCQVNSSSSTAMLSDKVQRTCQRELIECSQAKSAEPQFKALPDPQGKILALCVVERGK